ncbi:MAG: carbohydrate kinase [Salegentibacter sp.]|uniref:carbohydrate kinase family protein n=1 Tax=Salegentibacter sp. TaxID=1903072 RepID=UPI00286FF69F|nr:carbohydrate kinase [Salegentibacter sp.]MDR9456816.1 carbohydrate kinase [Salegentibacter sp.]
MIHKSAICFGEILIDVFPDKKRIGGAPLNVASRLQKLGIATQMISQVGEDENGKKLLSYLENNGVNADLVSVTPHFPSGVVQVQLSASGSASYEISYPAAWDKIQLSEEMKEAVKEANLMIFGSLVCRDEVSRDTLLELLSYAKFRVFDVNLRPPHYEKEILIELMQKADFIKFNDDELFEIAEILGSPFHSLEQNIHFLAEKTSTKDICVTKGRHGAVLLKDGKLYYNSGFKISVKDTVGAGDSFLASLLAKLFQDEEPQQALNFACAVGALVAGREGANPELSEKEINGFLRPV